MLIKAFGAEHASIHPESYLAENATIIGAVTLAAGASVWYGAVLRADAGSIIVGEGTCVEDSVILHGAVTLQDNCVIGHGAILHQCLVESGSLIGMGAIVLDGSIVGAGSIIAAGSLVHHSLDIPPGSLVMGSPARVIRTLRPEEQAQTLLDAVYYVDIAQKQLTAFGQSSKQS